MVSGSHDLILSTSKTPCDLGSLVRGLQMSVYKTQVDVFLVKKSTC